MCGRVADRSVQMLGGYGYIADHGMERFYRDVRLFRLRGHEPDPPAQHRQAHIGPGWPWQLKVRRCSATAIALRRCARSDSREP
jgi:hypothetical protein